MTEVDEVRVAQLKARTAFRSYARAVRLWVDKAQASPDHPTYEEEVVAAKKNGVVVVAATDSYARALEKWCEQNDKFVEVDPRG